MKKSKFVLGTVQLGMNYGVNNTTGQPNTDEALSILDMAWGGGVNTFDTAAAYGTSEEVLGEWLSSRSLRESAHIISKIKNTEVSDSLRKLGVEKLDGCLLHSADDMISKEIVKKLRIAKESGVVDHIGVSIYEPQQALRALEMDFDYIQVPYNVFDRRLDNVDFFEKAKEKNITVFARSIFLQGLLLIDPQKIPEHLSRAGADLERFNSIVKARNVRPIQAALMYVLGHSGIDHVIFGAETSQQVKEILEFSRAEPQKDIIEELKNAFSSVDASIVNPSLWSKK